MGERLESAPRLQTARSDDSRADKVLILFDLLLMLVLIAASARSTLGQLAH